MSEKPRSASFPYGEFDAREWAAEFVRIFGDRRDDIDEDLMLGWFANAIMTGYDKAKREHTAPMTELHYLLALIRGRHWNVLWYALRRKVARG